MPRNARKCFSSTFFHIMVQGVNREYIFDSNLYKNLYLKIIKQSIPQFNVNIISYCIMSNHAHILVNAEEIIDISNFMKKINTTYAMIYNNENNRVGHVFRNRYKSQPIKDLRQLYCCINYIHNNPVKAKMCINKEEYKFSSYKEYLNKGEIISEKIIRKYLGNEYLKELSQISKEKEFVFIEDEMDKKDVCVDLVNKYFNKNDIDIKYLKQDKEKLVELTYILKNNDISYRIMEEVLGIGRETLRKWMKNINRI
ncbi:MAG: transposase [Clostridia bacterium]|nr:transposase [Clostridia bacterium]